MSQCGLYHLLRSEIEDFQQSGTLTRFLVSFSREELHDGSAKYVYDNLRLHTHDIFHLIDEKAAIIYVCGDARNMAKDVSAAFINILREQKGKYVMFKLH